MPEQKQTRTFLPGQILLVNPREEKFLESLLSGRFSEKFIAKTLPQIKSGFDSEQPYLFEIGEGTRTNTFSALWVGLKTLKRQDFILIFFPLFLILTKNMSQGLLPQILPFFLILPGLIALVFSLRFRNQYVDHLRGMDRWNPESAQSPLMLGKLRAYELNRWSLIFLILATICLLPLLWLQPELLMLALPGVVLAVYTQYFRISAFKEKTYGEVLVFILFGPLFLSGLELAMFRRVQLSTLFDGFLIGLSSMFLLNLKVFSNFLFLSQLKSQNTLVKFGFDRARRYLIALGLLILFTFAIGEAYFHQGLLRWVPLVLAILLPFVYGNFFLRCESPAGSEVQQLRVKGTEAVYWMYLCWIGIHLWQVFVHGMMGL